MTDINDLDDVEEQFKIVKSRINNINRSLDTLEEENSELKQAIKDLEKENQQLRYELLERSAVEGEEITPAEEIMLHGWSAVHIECTENKERAIDILSEWDDLSIKTKSGGERVSYSNLVDEVESIEYYSAVKRAGGFVQELTEGKVQIKEDNEKTYLVKQAGVELIRDVSDLDD